MVGSISRATVCPLTLSFLGYAAYLNWPREREYQRFSRVFETRSNHITGKITIGDKTGSIDIPEFEDTVPKMVPSGTCVREPSKQEKLRGWLMAAVLVVSFSAMLSVLVAWVSYHMRGKTPPKELVGKFDKILTAAIAFAFGLAISTPGQEAVNRSIYLPGGSVETAPGDTGSNPPVAAPTPPLDEDPPSAKGQTPAK